MEALSVYYYTASVEKRWPTLLTIRSALFPYYSMCTYHSRAERVGMQQYILTTIVFKGK